MRISSATLLMVLVCLFGAIATSMLIVSQYQVVQDVREDTEKTRLAGRDLQQLKVMISQWYVAIDLFFENGESYVANGLQKQSEDMKTLWETLPTNTENDNKKGALYISNAANLISELAITGPSNPDTWNRGLNDVDKNTTLFAGLFEDLIHANATKLIFRADQLTKDQERLKTDSWAAAAIYLLSICLVWMWANRQIVQPITELDNSTRAARDSEGPSNGSQLLLTRGPTEIQQLSRSLGDYIDELAAKNSTIVQQKQELEARLEELERTRIQLVQAEKLASVGQLAAGIAHEINNPMAFVTSNLSSLNGYMKDIKKCITTQHDVIEKLAQEKDQEEDAGGEARDALKLWQTLDIAYVLEDCDEVLSDVRDGTQRITQIVTELSDFTDRSHDYEVVNLNQLASNVVGSVLASALPYHPVTQNLNAKASVLGAPQRLEHAIEILLVNALEASTNTAEPVVIETGSDGSIAWVEVRDSGPGVPKEDQLKIFDPFYTTKPLGDGLGLNLHFVQSIVEQHSGSIECTSNLLSGTHMKLAMPISHEPQNNAPATEDS